MSEFKLVAPCGIDCFNCEIYETNVTKSFQERLSKAYGVSEEEISCKGCQGGHQCLLLDLQGKTCETLKCIQSKGVQFCFECDEFPCSYLMPLASGADKFPQNMKVFNLCLMKKMGIEAWTEIAAENRTTYFTHAIQIGKGGTE